MTNFLQWLLIFSAFFGIRAANQEEVSQHQLDSGVPNWCFEALQLAGPILFIFLQISSAYTAVIIVVQQSVGKLSPIPFGSLFINCFIWSLYGRMENSKSILYPNLSGLFVGTFCVTIFHQFTQQKPWKMYGILLAMVILCMYLNKIGDSKSIGLVGCILSIVVSGSPLAVMRTVIKDKSTASLPFYTSAITWMNNLSWILFGFFVMNDPFIYLPNILGFFLASIQMILFVVYGMPPVSKKGDSDIEVDTKRLLSNGP